MKRCLWPGIVCLLGACGGSSSDSSDPDEIHTTEVCKVGSDCKMEPKAPVCRDERTAVRYETATCSADQRCAWSKLESHCDLRCEDGYCLSAAVR